MSAGRVQVGREFESYYARTRGPILNSATPELLQLLIHFFTARNIVDVRLLHL